MSHATFPGVAIASILGFSLFLGGSLFGLVVVVAVVALASWKVLDDATVAHPVVEASEDLVTAVQYSPSPGPTW